MVPAWEDADDVDGFERWLQGHVMQAQAKPARAGSLRLDLSSMDEPDGPGCARMAEMLREASRKVGLRLVSPPQVLAHTLYRVGATRGPHGLQIEEARSEIGTSS